MEPQTTAARDSCETLSPDDHRHIILARENGGVAEPTADLADEAAGPGEIGKPSRADHGRHNDVALFEIGQIVTTLHFRLRHDARAGVDNLAARYARSPHSAAAAGPEMLIPADSASRSQAVSPGGSEEVSYRRAACSRLREAVARNPSTFPFCSIAISSNVRWNTSPSRRKLRSRTS